mmetsp:Transcript_15577/g.44183  ORF Transcript_15577/g.44183 Transcript_15577/m.44183 type:complete len:704 (-) Transcript_15577:2-2113(-)
MPTARGRACARVTEKVHGRRNARCSALSHFQSNAYLLRSPRPGAGPSPSRSRGVAGGPICREHAQHAFDEPRRSFLGEALGHVAHELGTPGLQQQPLEAREVLLHPLPGALRQRQQLPGRGRPAGCRGPDARGEELHPLARLRVPGQEGHDAVGRLGRQAGDVVVHGRGHGPVDEPHEFGGQEAADGGALVAHEVLGEQPQLGGVERLGLGALLQQVLQALPAEVALAEQEVLQRGPQLRRGVRQQPLGHVWVRLGQHFVPGVGPDGEPLEHSERPQDEGVVRRHLEGVLEEHLAEAVDDRLEVQLLHGGLEDVVEELGQGRGDGRRVHGAVDEFQGVVVPAHGHVVPVHEMDHVLDDGVASVLRRFRHHPKVQVAQVAPPGGQQVAGMGVGVEVPVLEQLPQGALDPDVHKGDDFQARRPHGLVVRQLHPVHPLHRQHPAAAPLPHDFRHAHARDVPVQLRELLRALALLEVVQLAEEAPGELVHERHQPLREGGDAVHEHHEPPQEEHVEGDGPADAGPLHLDGHLLPRGRQPPFVHLPQARRRHRLFAQLGEDLSHRPPQLLLYQSVRHGSGERGEPVLQRGQGLEVGAGQQVRPGAQGLAHFHEGRAEAREDPPELLRAQQLVLLEPARGVVLQHQGHEAPQLGADLERPGPDLPLLLQHGALQALGVVVPPQLRQQLPLPGRLRPRLHGLHPRLERRL